MTSTAILAQPATTCRFCGLVVTHEPYGGNRDYAPEWHSDNDDAGHSGFRCLSDESPEGQHEPVEPSISERIFASVEQSRAAFRIRRAVRAGLKVSPEFAALCNGNDDAALVAAAKTEGAPAPFVAPEWGKP